MEVINTSCNQLTVTDVQYGNDGLSNVVNVFWNTRKIGQFTSKAVVNSGDGWNVFHSSGQVGNPVQINKGVYNLQIQLSESSDEYGIEMDKVSLQLYCSSINVNNQYPESTIKVDGGSITGSTATTDTSTTGSTPTTGGTAIDGGTEDDTPDGYVIASTIGGLVGIAAAITGVITTWYLKCYRKRRQ